MSLVFYGNFAIFGEKTTIWNNPLDERMATLITHWMNSMLLLWLGCTGKQKILRSNEAPENSRYRLHMLSVQMTDVGLLCGILFYLYCSNALAPGQNVKNDTDDIFKCRLSKYYCFYFDWKITEFCCCGSSWKNKQLSYHDDPIYLNQKILVIGHSKISRGFSTVSYRHCLMHLISIVL